MTFEEALKSLEGFNTDEELYNDDNKDVEKPEIEIRDWLFEDAESIETVD